MTATTQHPERCKVCGGASHPFGNALLLRKYDARYYQCGECRFVQTETPYWLPEAYKSALVAADVGAVQRNLELAEITQVAVQQFFSSDGQFLDYGGGHGLFVRLMRDRGFDFRWHDKYAANLFSVGFAASEDDRPFELVTAFEVFEHLVDPAAEVSEMLRRGNGSLLCTTQLLPSDNPRPGEWWYYVPTGGQHIAIYTLAALKRLAERSACYLVTDGAFLHLFSRQRISERLFRFVIRGRVRALLNRVRTRASLIATDFAAITGDMLD